MGRVIAVLAVALSMLVPIAAVAGAEASSARPAVVTVVVATALDRGVTVSWAAPPSSDGSRVDRYRLLVAPARGGPFRVAYQGPRHAVTLPHLRHVSTSFFTVAAHDPTGWGRPSRAVRATRAHPTPTPAPSPAPSPAPTPAVTAPPTTSPSPSSTPSPSPTPVVDAPTGVTVAATSADQTLQVSFTLATGYLHGATYSSVAWSASDGASGQWGASAGVSGAAGSYTVDTSPLPIENAPVTVTVRVVATAGGATVYGASATSTTTGSAATPYGPPNPPVAADPPCGDPAYAAGSATSFWAPGSANGRPVAGFVIAAGGATTTTGVTTTSFTRSVPADGSWNSVTVRSVDSLGQTSAPLMITCQDPWPAATFAAWGEATWTCFSISCRSLDVAVQWWPPGTYDVDVSYDGAWQTGATQITVPAGGGYASFAGVWWNFSGGHTVQARIVNPRTGSPLYSGVISNW